MSRPARLGLFIFTTLVILGAGIFIIGDRQFLFSPHYTIQASFDNVAGLINGADVRIGGVRKGTVHEIRLPSRPGERVSVLMDLENSTRKVIKKDSIAAIETEGLLGNKFVTVSFGSANSAPIHEGDTIESRPPVDLSDLVKKTDQIMDATYLALKNVRTATANIDDITTKVNRGEGTVGALINDQKLYNEFSATATEAHKTVDEAYLALKSVRTATANIDDVTSKVNRGEGTVGALINDRKLYNELSATATEAHNTVVEAKMGVTAFQEDMQALKKNWFFRKFFKDRGFDDVNELTKYSIDRLPEKSPSQVFTYDASSLFDKPDNAKLKNEKSLRRVGTFLEKSPFGLAVVTASEGLAGDHEENLMLSEARAVVVRQYLAKKFKLDDARLKTKGLGEEKSNSEGKGDRIQILVYPQDS